MDNKMKQILIKIIKFEIQMLKIKVKTIKNRSIVNIINLILILRITILIKIMAMFKYVWKHYKIYLRKINEATKYKT